jgi:hypothetical protein
MFSTFILGTLLEIKKGYEAFCSTFAREDGTALHLVVKGIINSYLSYTEVDAFRYVLSAFQYEVLRLLNIGTMVKYEARSETRMGKLY